MEHICRMLDANVNRASEAARVLEDVARFIFDDGEMSSIIRNIKHDIRKGVKDLFDLCISSRNTINDVGVNNSFSTSMDSRDDIRALVTANFKRIEEALRSIEECLKILDRYEKAKCYEKLRFDCYCCEKDFFQRHFNIIADVFNKRKDFTLEGLYCITAEQYSNGRRNIEVVQQMINSGVKYIQYREKEKTLKQKYEECVKIREMTSNAGVFFIINDHVDLAMIIGADGIHIGQDDIPLKEVRKIAGPKMIIGISTHCPEQAVKAVEDGADYIGVGPIYRTFTKKDVCDPVGIEYLKFVVDNLNIPFVAIGGIKENNIHEVINAGARCVALVTEIVGAEDIKAKIKNIQSLIKAGKKSKIFN